MANDDGIVIGGDDSTDIRAVIDQIFGGGDPLVQITQGIAREPHRSCQFQKFTALVAGLVKTEDNQTNGFTWDEVEQVVRDMRRQDEAVRQLAPKDQANPEKIREVIDGIELEFDYDGLTAESEAVEAATDV